MKLPARMAESEAPEHEDDADKLQERRSLERSTFQSSAQSDSDSSERERQTTNVLSGGDFGSERDSRDKQKCDDAPLQMQAMKPACLGGARLGQFRRHSIHGVSMAQASRPDRSASPRLRSDALDRSNSPASPASPRVRSDAPSSQAHPRMMRRASLPGGMGVGMTDDATESKGSGEGGPRSDWMARLLSGDVARNDVETGSKQLLEKIETAMPGVEQLPAKERKAVLGVITLHKQRAQEALTRAAYTLARVDFEELVNLRSENLDMQSKNSRMTEAYLKEITSSRDQRRGGNDLVQQVVEQAEKNVIEFYEPLQYLPTTTRSAVLACVEERLKDIFTKRPDLQEEASKVEMARFQESLTQDRLEALEKLNAKLRDENRDLQLRVKKAEVISVKSEWEMKESAEEGNRLKEELAKAEERIKELEAQVRTASKENSAEDRLSNRRLCAQDGELRDLLQEKADLTARISELTMTIASLNVELREAKAAKAERHAPQCDSAAQTDTEESVPFKRLISKSTVAEETDPWDEQDTQHCSKVDDTRRPPLRRRKSRELQDGVGDLSQSLPPTLETLPDVSTIRAAKDRPGEHGEQCAVQDPSLPPALAPAKCGAGRGSLRAEVDDLRHQKSDLEQRHALLQKRNAELESRLKERDQNAVQPREAKNVKGVEAELKMETEARIGLAKELEEAKSAIKQLLARNAALEEMANAADDGGSEDEWPGVAVQKVQAMQEEKELEVLRMQRAKLRTKSQSQRAKLQELGTENEILHLALVEMQQELQGLTKQLRDLNKEVVPPDLDKVLNKMEALAKKGAGAYIRLNKDARLREVAAMADKYGIGGNEQVPERAADEELEEDTTAPALPARQLVGARERRSSAAAEKPSAADSTPGRVLMRGPVTNIGRCIEDLGPEVQTVPADLGRSLSEGSPATATWQAHSAVSTFGSRPGSKSHVGQSPSSGANTRAAPTHPIEAPQPQRILRKATFDGPADMTTVAAPPARAQSPKRAQSLKAGRRSSGSPTPSAKLLPAITGVERHDGHESARMAKAAPQLNLRR